MIRRVIFGLLIFTGMIVLASFKSKPVMAQSGTQAIILVPLDNTAGTIDIDVTVHFYNNSGEFLTGSPITRTVTKGTTLSLYSSLDPMGNVPPYSIRWSTSCSDPPVVATYTGTWGDGIGPSIAAYQTDPQDVHCTTPNATPAITNTACANVGWTLAGVGVNGANIASFSVYESTNSSQIGPGDPTIAPYASGLSPGARSYNFGFSTAGTYYVRVRAISPQGVGSWSSVGSFNCGAAITPASLSGVFTSCAGSGPGNIVNAAFGWTTSSPNPSDEQWIDYSVANNNFAPGPYLQNANVGPGTQVYTTGGLAQGQLYYWRINNRYGTNWYPSSTGTFVTPSCPVTTSTPVPATPTPTPGPVCPAGCTAPANITASWGAETGYVSAAASTLFGTVTGNCSSANNSCTISNTFPANWPVLYNVLAGGSSGPAIVSNGSTTTNNSGVATFNWNIPYAVKYCAVSSGSATSCPAGTAPNPTYFLSYTITNPSPNQWYHVTVWTPCDPADSGCGGGVNYFNSNYLSGSCNCPTPNPTPTPVPAVITLTGYSDCVDGVNPLVHLTWTSNTGNTAYAVYRDGVAQASGLSSTTRSWNSPGAQPAGGHSWLVQGTGGTFGTVNSSPVSITTATCTPPPADPSNLQVTSACDASGNPVLTFRWLNNASTEQGFWLDVSHDAFTGPSSTTVSPSVWGVKGVTSTAPSGTTIQFIWNSVSPTTNTQGILDSGDVDSAVAGNQLAPERGVVYYWRVKAYSASQQSNHVYPTSTTVPPGISFTSPNCMFDLQVTNNPGGNTQVYGASDPVTFKVQVTNTSAAQIAYPGGGSLGAWTLSNLPSPGPSCPGTPVTPVPNPPTNTIQSISIPPLAIGASTIITLTTFTAPNAPGTNIAYFYALPNCAPNNDSNWTNNAFQLTYAVSAKAWFETTGGDVGARGSIQVANPTIPVGHMQSTAALAGNPLSSNVVGLWELNNYAHPVFPTDSGGVYGYFNSRFYQKITTSPNSYNKGATCGPMTVNGVGGLMDTTGTGTPPPGDAYFYCSGDLTFQGAGVASMIVPQHNYVVYVGGNLNILGNFGPLTGSGSSIIFIVAGNVNVNTSASRTDGIYIVGGTFNDYDNVGGIVGNQLSIYGAIYTHAFNLGRILSNLPACDPTCTNSKTPADIIYYQPRYLVALTQMIGSPTISWQEVAP